MEFFARRDGPDDDASVRAAGYEHGRAAGGGPRREVGRHDRFDEVGVAVGVDAVRGARARVPGVDVFIPAPGEEDERSGGGIGGDSQARCRCRRAAIRRRDFIVLQKRAVSFYSPFFSRFLECLQEGLFWGAGSSPTSNPILRAVPVLSATKTALPVGSTMTAKILLCSRMGAPCRLLDFRAFRRVSAKEWL